MSFVPKKSSSVYALVIANIVPLFGIIFFGWDATMVLYLYWAENIVVGFYTVLRIVAVRASLGKKLVTIPFFIFHFGFFTFGHGVFVFVLSRIASGERTMPANPTDAIISMIQLIGFALFPIFISHGISFWKNYIGNNEYTRDNIDSIMSRPYSRIVVTHITLIIGGGAVIASSQTPFGESLAAKLVLPTLLIVLKTAMDVTRHIKSHSRKV